MLADYGYTRVDNNWRLNIAKPTVIFRIYLVESGYAEFYSKEKNMLLKPNHIYIFPNTSPYKIRNHDNDFISHIFLHISSDSYILSKIVECNVDDYSDIKHIFEIFKNLIGTKKLDDNVELQNSLSSALLNLFDLYGFFENIDERITSSVKYILSHLNENLDLDYLAEMAGYHTKYYTSIFSKNIGLSPHQFIISARMNKAFSLLSKGMSVQDVANEVGYSESKNFTRAFKQRFDVTPTKIDDYIDVFNAKFSSKSIK